MKQFVLPPEDEHAETVQLTGRAYQYLKVVRRYQRGDSLPALTTGGVPKTLTITDIRDGVILGLLSPRPSGEESPEGASRRGQLPAEADRGGASYTLVLCPATLKGRKLDQVVRQATEAGVAGLRPVVTDRCVSDPLGSGRGEKKSSRWRTIAREAVQQSGRGSVPFVEEPVHLDTLLEELPPEGRLLFCHEADPGAPPLGETLSHLEEGVEISLVLGPEGGLAPEEVAKLRRVGGVPCYLGPRVLRSESAALYAIAAVQTLLREVRGWE
ncbi:MAG: RsmE family RNA methyltransferase [Alkalispirochaetaceae bacterium]